jgi:hypothetical protein
VACCAGDLVEQVSDLSGAMWQTSALSLRGLGLVRRNSEFHHFDILGAAGVITDGNAVVLSDNLYDAFGVQRYAQGQAQTPWRWEDRKLGDESLLSSARFECLAGRGIEAVNRWPWDCSQAEWKDCFARCLKRGGFAIYCIHLPFGHHTCICHKVGLTPGPRSVQMWRIPQEAG